jgi:hypothetical protein
MSRTRAGLGEFFLIVVGVFLALAAERWVSGSADRQLVDQYSADLVTDLASDSVSTERWTALAEEIASALERLIGSLNETGKPLVASEALNDLHWAQVVPVPTFEVTTYQDLVSSGNLRLLEPELRRSLVEYHAALEYLARIVGLTGAGDEKPFFAYLVPARARIELRDRCRSASPPETHACRLHEAEALFGMMSEHERDAISSWADLPGIRFELERTLAGILSFLGQTQVVASARAEVVGVLTR